MADQARVLHSAGFVEHAAMLMSEEGSVDPIFVQHPLQLVAQNDADIGTVFEDAEQLMMREHDGLLSILLEHVTYPTALGVLEAVIVPRRVQAENLPMLVEQAKEARLALSSEARILQQRVEIAVSAGIHVVIAVEAPRTGSGRMFGLDRPVREKTLPVFIGPAGIVDVAQMDDVHLLVPVQARAHFIAHRGRDLLRTRDSTSPIANQNDSRPIVNLDRRGGLLGERTTRAEQADSFCHFRADPTDIGDGKAIENAPAVARVSLRLTVLQA